jgi:hypothetical protein
MKPFAMIVVIFLSLLALLQLARFFLGWVVTVQGVVIPVWVSGIAFVIAGLLAVMLWWESRR